MDDKDYTPQYIPPPIQLTEFVLGPEWLEACAKYGHDPLEFQAYSSMKIDRQLIEEIQADTEYELDLIRTEYEVEATRLAAIIAYDPQRFTKLLIKKDDDCKDWCCNDFAA